jgi:hypothetical protein
MKRVGFFTILLTLSLAAFVSAPAQDGAVPAIPVSIQQVIRISGAISSATSAPATVGVTFALYKDQAGGVPLWIETQNVAVDGSGHYTAYLGANHAQGVPPELFASGEARWLGVQASGQAEQPRLLLAAVPYAMKAVDADTLGGVPASSYVSSQANLADYKALVETIVEQMKSSGALAPLTATAGATNFSDTTSNQVVGVTQLGTGKGINATTPSGQTIYASNTATTGTVYAVYATGASPAAIPIRGVATAATGTTRGVQGNSASTSGVAGYFEATATSGTYGVEGVTDSPSGYGLYGIGQVNGMKSIANATTGETTAFIGTVNSPSGIAAIFNNNAGGPLASFRNSGVQEIGFDATGDVTAAGAVTGKTLVSTVAQGTPPLTVSSTTEVPNLDAGYLGGEAASAYPLLFVANTFTANQAITGSNLNVVIGDMGCGGTSAGISFGAPSGCTNYALLGGATDTYFNAASAGTMHFRLGNADEVLLSATGGLSATLSSANAITGTSTSDIGGYFTGGTYGVEGYEPLTAYAAVYGQSGTRSTIGGGDFSAEQLGVWGDANSGSFAAVVGTTDDALAGAFYNNSYGLETIFAENFYTSTASVLETYGSGGYCTFNTAGVGDCSGGMAMPARGASGRVLEVPGMYTTENWIEDFGSGQLQNGHAAVALEAGFAELVNTGIAYHVFLTPEGDCKGLYVVGKTADGFEVRELQGGHASIAFDYRIAAKRRGKESARLRDVTEQDKKARTTPAERRAAKSRNAAQSKATAAPGVALREVGVPPPLQRPKPMNQKPISQQSGKPTKH